MNAEKPFLSIALKTVGIKQRRFFKACWYEGTVSTVSTRALMH
jgi:hypothetical protein